MHKTLAIIDHEPELKGVIDRLTTMRNMAEEKAKFLHKQLQDFMEEEEKKIKPMWKEIEQVLLKLGRLPPDFNKETHVIHLDRDDGTLVLCDGDHSVDGSQFLKALFQGGIVLK